nr:copia protein [Tanacetum cinerariifolium]
MIYDLTYIRYSLNSKAFRVYNIRTRKVEENLHVRFLEDKPSVEGIKESIGTSHSSMETGSSQDYILMPLWKDGSLFDPFLKNASNDEPQPSSDDKGVNKDSGIDYQEKSTNSLKDINTVGLSINTASPNFHTGSLNINTVSPTISTKAPEATHADLLGDDTKGDISNIPNTYQVVSTPNRRIHKDHSLDQVVGDVQSGVLTRRMTKTTNKQRFINAIYEGKTHEDEELLQLKLQKVWILVDLPKEMKAIGTKWVFRNKKDERGIVIKKKERLVEHDYTQEEGIDYDEVFAPVARIEAIRLFLAYASFMGFMVYQMDVKSDFLYERIEEEVYVCQPPGLEDPDHPKKVYKVQKEDGIFISQDKYVTEVLRKFNFSDAKSASTPIDTKKPLVKDADVMIFQVTPKVSHLHVVKRIFRYLKGKPKLGLGYPRDFLFELVAYTDSDYVGASLDRKSTTGGCQFLGCKLISWQCKKKTVVATSTTKAEYMAAASCCRQTQTPRQALHKVTELPQTSEPIPNVADEAVYKEWDDRVEKAATTAASLDAAHASGNILKTQSTIIPNVNFSQGTGAGGSPRYQEAMGGSITQTRSERVPTQPHDSPLPRVNTLGSDECSTTVQELTIQCTTLSQKLESLEEDLKQTKQVNRANYTKLIMKVKRLEKTFKTSKARRQAKIVVFDDEEEFKDPSKQGRNAAKVHTYTKRKKAVNTGSDEISTASRIVSTAEKLVSSASASMLVNTTGMIDKEERDKYSGVDQEKMLVDLINQRKKYFAAKRAEERRKKPMTQAQQRTYMSNYIKHIGSYTLKQLKKLSFKEIKELFKATMRSINTFVPMESEDDKAVPKLAKAGSLKRDAEEELKHEGSKKQKD